MLPIFSLCFLDDKFIFYNKKDDIYLVKNKEEAGYFLNYNKVFVLDKSALQRAFANTPKENLYDILELFVFIYPKSKAVSTYGGLYQYLISALGDSFQDKSINKAEDKLLKEAKICFEIINIIIKNLKCLPIEERKELITFLRLLDENNWNFAKSLLKIMDDEGEVYEYNPFNVWSKIKEYKKNNENKEIIVDDPINPITDVEVIENFKSITHNLKKRQEQETYVLAVSKIFQESISVEENSKQIVIAEAGTGIGKTLSYLSAIFSFLKKNPNQQVLISTYSKALQKQILSEIDKYFSKNSDFLATYTVIKGSNNYICLLNYQSLVDNNEILNNHALFLSILARWLKVTEYGDLVGGDLNPIMFNMFPNYFFSLMLNKKDECIYTRCKHFKNCFVMKAKYLAKNSNIVISNHSFSLLTNGLGIKHAVFDEAHHLFHAADEVFTNDFSLKSTVIIKKWIEGYSANLLNSKSKLNGLKARVSGILDLDIAKDDNESNLNIKISNAINALISACAIFPENYALDRIKNHKPKTLVEEFLYEVYLQIISYNNDLEQFYSKEISVDTIRDNLSESFCNILGKLSIALKQITRISNELVLTLREKAGYSEEEDQKSVEEFIRVFERVIIAQIQEFIKMLNAFETHDSEYIYRLVLQKEEGKEVDIGYYKNYVDPTKPMAISILDSMQGICFTSATLSSADSSFIMPEKKLKEAKLSIKNKNPSIATPIILKEINSVVDVNLNNKEIHHEGLKKQFGIDYMTNASVDYLKLLSPFNYKENSKVIVINSNFSQDKLSHAIAELFKASSGGALAIFTSINRLKNVYHNVNSVLNKDNIRVFAQHINDTKFVNLVDMFKEDINSCLLATDSARDGIDIPGDSLRLVILEKVPWSKSDILFKKRKEFFGKSYAEDLAKLKIRQGFGRLIRKEDDKGIFVLFGNQVPSKLLNVFPKDSTVSKISLEEAIKEVKDFFLLSSR